MDLTTKARVKTILAITSTQQDAILDQFIVAVSAEVEQFLTRHAEELARVEQFDLIPGDRKIFLRGFPVIAPPTATFELRHDLDRQFTGTPENLDDFYVDFERGVITADRGVIIAPGAFGPGVLQVTYTGGMAPDTATFITRFSDVAHAVDLQVAFLFRRKDQLGQVAFSSEGGSISIEAPLELISPVKTALERHRRMVFS